MKIAIEFTIRVEGKYTFITANGQVTKHRTTWIRKMSVNDLTETIKDGLLKSL